MAATGKPRGRTGSSIRRPSRVGSGAEIGPAVLRTPSPVCVCGRWLSGCALPPPSSEDAHPIVDPTLLTSQNLSLSKPPAAITWEGASEEFQGEADIPLIAKDSTSPERGCMSGRCPK